MSLRVLLQENPRRSVALATDTHALVFRYNERADINTVRGSHGPRCMVEFSSVDAVQLDSFKPVLSGGVFGTLGLINIDTDIFLCVVTKANTVASVRQGETVQRIVSVDFICLNRSGYFNEIETSLAYDTYDLSAEDHGNGNYGGLDYKDAPQHPCLSLKQILGDGTFYYSTEFDLTNRLQNRASELSAFDVDSLDHSFLWNSYMVGPLIEFRSHLGPTDRQRLDASHILTSAIRGYAYSITIPAPASPVRGLGSRLPTTLTLISRLSCRRAGTRFNSRGLDDDGNVANFVESETIYCLPDGACFSYAQVRGSVPVFWEQSTGLLPQQQKIQIARSPEATQPAFNKHFEDLELKYGTVHVLNLLSKSKSAEAELTLRYNYHIEHCSLNQHLSGPRAPDHNLLQQSHFDFHYETKGPNGYEAASLIQHVVSEQAEGFAFFLSNRAAVASADRKVDGTGVVLQQEGVFRTNCLDCLDRTNLVQTIISQMALQAFFRQNSDAALQDFWMRHSTLWADNGDALSKIYAGTGALKSSFTRHGKMSLAGALADARKSATRLYMNNFADKTRQNVMDTLLGRLVDQMPVQLYDPINDFVNAELQRRATEYSSSLDINVLVGTFNVNGKSNGLGENLSSWLCPKTHSLSQSPDVVAIGFQEIVELSPNQILSTDPSRRHEWEVAVLRTLNTKGKSAGHDDYVLLRSGQLVGAALMLFVKTSRLPHRFGLYNSLYFDSIKNVEGSIKKTGMSGMAGNKGAVAIRFDLANTRICFITAHLAAGFANYDERNADYRTINHGLRFQRNRSIEDHDTIIWLGDFNYRIGLSNEKVRQYLEAGDLGMLFKHDQLNLQMVAGNTFPFYNEAQITFLPTYKYDNGTDEFDTSEKARIPAWCDRVLWKANNLEQISYATAPLRFSDHRPVFATFRCSVRRDDEQVKQRLSREIYRQRRALVMRRSSHGTLSDTNTENTGTTLQPIAPGLAVASSERQRWWLNGNGPVRSGVLDTNQLMGRIPNDRSHSNPFKQSPESDWVSKTTPPSTSKPVEVRHSATNDIDKARVVSESGSSTTSRVERHASEDLAHIDDVDQRDQRHSRSRSSSKSIMRKPAPPVPRKPHTLASAAPIATQDIRFSQDRQSTSFVPTDHLAAPWVRSPQSMNIGDSQLNANYNPDSGVTTGQRAFNSSQSARLSGVDTPPPLPTRPNVATTRNLVDQDDGEIHLPSLLPLRPS